MCRVLIVACEEEAERICAGINGLKPEPEFVRACNFAEAAELPDDRWDTAVIDADMTGDPKDGLGLAQMLNERSGGTVAMILTSDPTVAQQHGWETILPTKQDGGYASVGGMIEMAEPIIDHERAQT